MTPDEIVKALREDADWCDANEYEIPLCMGDNQREAADLIESLQAENERIAIHGGRYMQLADERYKMFERAIKRADDAEAQLAEKDAEIKRLNDEPPAYKFYYCESEDSYLLGRRVGNFYYAHWHDGIGFVFDMSRYLPWGEHVVAPRTVWKEHTYPSEPKEINLSEWFNGFLAQRLSASHRRERAAVEDLKLALIDEALDPCHCCEYGCIDHCTHPDGPTCGETGGKNWKWRGHQEDGKGEQE